MTADETSKQEAEAAFLKRLWIGGGALIAVIAVGVVGCTVAYSGEAPASQCTDLVRDVHLDPGAAQFVDVTFTDGDYVKGTIGQIRGDDEWTAGHWECSVTSGEAEITFYSPAP